MLIAPARRFDCNTYTHNTYQVVGGRLCTRRTEPPTRTGAARHEDANGVAVSERRMSSELCIRKEDSHIVQLRFFQSSSLVYERSPRSVDALLRADGRQGRQRTASEKSRVVLPFVRARCSTFSPIVDGSFCLSATTTTTTASDGPTVRCSGVEVATAEPRTRTTTTKWRERNRSSEDGETRGAPDFPVRTTVGPCHNSLFSTFSIELLDVKWTREQFLRFHITKSTSRRYCPPFSRTNKRKCFVSFKHKRN